MKTALNGLESWEITSDYIADHLAFNFFPGTISVHGMPCFYGFEVRA